MTTTLYFTREALEQQSTVDLLTLLPEGYYVGKDAGLWMIFDLDHSFSTPLFPGTLRECLIEFLFQYPFTGDEIEITRWALATSR